MDCVHYMGRIALPRGCASLVGSPGRVVGSRLRKATAVAAGIVLSVVATPAMVAGSEAAIALAALAPRRVPPPRPGGAVW